MISKLLCLFAMIFLFSFMPAAKAGFAIKKQALAIAAASHHTEQATTTFASFKHAKNRPYYPFAYGGWIGFVALICGIAGFFYGGFAIVAVLFGIWGMGRRHRNTGLAIAGFVLGLAAITLAIVSTFSGFPIF